MGAALTPALQAARSWRRRHSVNMRRYAAHAGIGRTASSSTLEAAGMGGCVLLVQQKTDPGALLHRHFHPDLCLAGRIEDPDLELAVAEHPESDAVTAGRGREVQHD